MIKKRYFHLIEKMLEEHPNIGAYMAPSINIRQEIITAEIPKLGKEAALKELKEWGRPMQDHPPCILYNLGCRNAWC